MSRGNPSSGRQVSDLTPPMTTNVSAPDPAAGERPPLPTEAPCGGPNCPGAACRGTGPRPATPDADDASERLTEAERASIYATVRGYDEDQHPGPIYAAVERIKAAAATKARAEAWHEGYASALSKPEIDKVRAKVLTDAADEWHGFGAGRGVMFNRDRLDLTPQQRVEKWLRDRAARIAGDGGR